MDTTNDTQKLKLNFLEFWRNISVEDTQSLITLENTALVKNKISKYCDKIYSLDKVLQVFHAYASVAYLSAERIVNAKIYFDIAKTRYIILARKVDCEIYSFSIVYSNISELSKFSTFPIPADNILDYLESDDAVEHLKDFYKENYKK